MQYTTLLLVVPRRESLGLLAVWPPFQVAARRPLCSALHNEQVLYHLLRQGAYLAHMSLQHTLLHQTVGHLRVCLQGCETGVHRSHAL